MGGDIRLVAALGAAALAFAARGQGAVATGPAQEARAPAAGAATRPAPGARGVFLLASGAHVAGRLVSVDQDGDVVELASGVRLRFPPGAVVALERPEAPDSRPVPEPSRAFAVRTAFGVPRGEMQLGTSVSEPIAVAYGLGWGIGAELSGVAPLYAEGSSLLGVGLRLDWAATLTRWLHVGTGVRATGGRSPWLAAAHGSISLGPPRLNATLYAGPPLPGAPDLGAFEPIVIGAAGNARVTRHVAVLAEAWTNPQLDPDAWLVAGGARILVHGFAADLGVLVGADRVAPWLALVWGAQLRRP